jgi:hypothetical protein
LTDERQQRFVHRSVSGCLAGGSSRTAHPGIFFLEKECFSNIIKKRYNILSDIVTRAMA